MEWLIVIEQQARRQGQTCRKLPQPAASFAANTVLREQRNAFAVRPYEENAICRISVHISVSDMIETR